MKFLAPSSFLFLGALGIILLFYILKRRRVEHIISSTLLWTRFLAETQANAPFQKLRRHLLMLIQMLAVVILVLALVRPVIEGPQEMSGLNVIIVDASGSMLTEDVEPNRFSVAKQDARNLIEGLKPGARAILIRMGATTEIAQSTTSQKSRLLEALDAMSAGAGPAASDSAFQLAESLVRNPTATTDIEEGIPFVPGASIHLFSDGGVFSLEDLATQNLPISYYPVGSRQYNLAITATDARPSALDPTNQTLFVELQNFSTNSINGVLTVSFNGQELENRGFAIPGDDKLQSIFTVQQPENGIYEIVASCDDDLAIDNRAWIASRLPSPTKALLVTPGNYFLEKAMRAIKGIELTVLNSFPDLTGNSPGYDVIVSDRISPPSGIGSIPGAHYLWINSQPTEWFSSTDSNEAPIPTSANWTHPVLRFVSLDQLLIARSQKVQLPIWGSPILQSTSSPLIFEGELNGAKHIWIGFDLLESNWPRQVSFPVFIYNSVQWLASKSDEKSEINKLTGDTLTFRHDASSSSPSSNQKIEVTLPNGRRTSFQQDENSRLAFLSQTEESGIYQVTIGDQELDIAVNATHLSESRNAPAPSLKLGEVTEIAGTRILNAQNEIWQTIALILLAILLFEWWFFHKKTV